MTCRLLVVDDDEDIRAVVSNVLMDEGYDVACACDGAEALLVLQTSAPTPRLLLLDWMMPGVNGEEFRRRQLGDPTLADIPVVVLSASPLCHEIVDALRPASVLKKPFDLDDLIDVVRRHAPLD